MNQPSDIDNARNLGRFLRDLMAGKTGHEAAALTAAFRRGIDDDKDQPAIISLPIDKLDPSTNLPVPLSSTDPSMSLQVRYGEALISIIYPGTQVRHHVYLERDGNKTRFCFNEEAEITLKPDGSIKCSPS